MIYNIPKHTKCTNCGQCCGIIPATTAEVNAIRDYIAVNGINPIEYKDKSTCPFRDRKNKKCLVYPVRPLICRLFGVTKANTNGFEMKCINGNSAEIDGTDMINNIVKRGGEIKILNYMRW